MAGRTWSLDWVLSLLSTNVGDWRGRCNLAHSFASDE
jgi:hypothetical protein